MSRIKIAFALSVVLGFFVSCSALTVRSDQPSFTPGQAEREEPKVRAAVKKDPNNPQMRLGLANILMWQNKFAPAISEYTFYIEHAKSLSWDLPWALSGRAFCYIGLNELKKAIPDCKASLKLAPTDGCEKNLISVYRKLNMKAEAAAEEKLAMRRGLLMPRDAQVEMGEQLLDTRQTSAALKWFNATKFRNTNSVRYYMLLAELQLLDQDDRASIQSLDYCCQTCDLSPKMFQKRGLAKIRIGDLDGAISDLTKAIQLEGEVDKVPPTQFFGTIMQSPVVYDQALLLREAAYIRQKKFQLALNDLTTLLTKYKKWPEETVLQNRAHCYSELKQFDAALTDINAAIKIAPATSQITMGREKAIILSKAGKDKEFLAEMNKLIALCPTDETLPMDLSDYYYKKKEFAKSLIELDKSIKKDPDKNPALFEMRAETNMKLNKYKDAANDLTQAIKLSRGASVEKYYDVRAYIYETLKMNDLAKADLAMAEKLSWKAAWANQHEFGFGMIGVRMGIDGSEVFYVLPNGPAAKAGVKVGDLITTVDGKTLKDDALLQALYGKVGSTAALGIMRNGKPLRIAVVREDLYKKEREAAGQ